jgi:hypothetical protein
MSTQSLTDDLLLIACGSREGEMRALLDELLRNGSVPRETVAAEARRVIGLLRLQAKSMEQLPLLNLNDDEAARLGLRDWIETTRARAGELRKEADEFEETAIAATLLTKDDVTSWSARGLLRGLDVSDDEIEEAQHSLFRANYDDNV